MIGSLTIRLTSTVWESGSVGGWESGQKTFPLSLRDSWNQDQCFQSRPRENSPPSDEIHAHKKTGRSKTLVLLLPVFSLSSIEKCLPQGLLAVVLVRNCQFFTSLGTACGEHATAVLCCHSLTETMLVHAAAVVRLKCSFHCSLSLLFCCYISLVQAQCCSLRVQKYT